ncbi:hypothetical protein [Changchengzhania lutea]|uniref:hypothetical protein n=1 Tax=Changchengzhania lutea TaxID=2049305 RepID=UPI00115CBFF2|nr:hypothetical protein [Changchengzhania lutea]
MRIHNYLKMHVLKVFILLGIIGLNNSIIYAQDSKEDAVLAISFSEENDRKVIVTKATDHYGLPIEDLELYFYVKRTFSLLPIGDPFNATDENGIVEVEFPNDLPGDAKGNVIIITKIIESDLYHDLSIENIKKWGVPTIQVQSEEKRSLWAAAANAPISLILIVSIMIISVWYIIFYILFKLYKISKIKPLNG